jgi:hypothetical protein
MDSAFPHLPRILPKLGEKNTIAITFPFRTTDLSQASGLVFFGALQNLKGTAVGEFDDDSVNAQIAKLVQVYEETEISSTIRRSFRKTGTNLNVTVQPSRIPIVG